MLTKLDIGALQALCAIQDAGGVSRAARSLALSQSAVSHKVRRLEESLGCQLLNRNPGQPSFSKEGERLLSYARRILTIHNEAITSLSTEALSGVIRLGITERLASHSLASILGRFSRLQSNVSVHTEVLQSLTIAEQLDRGEIDVGVFDLFTDDCCSDDILLSESTLIWAKSRDLELQYDRPIPFLSFDKRCFYRQWAMEGTLIPPNGFSIVMQCASLSGILAALRAGLGVALLSEEDLETDLVAITEGFAPPPPVGTIIRVRKNISSRAVQALVKQISIEKGLPPKT